MANGFQENLPGALIEAYEVEEYGHASAILLKDFPEEFDELCDALMRFRIKKSMIMESGGSESQIPKTFSGLLRPLGWEETKLEAKMVVDDKPVSRETHKIDFVKGRVAVDFEWNSKDQTFDRDLYAFRAFHEYNRVSVAVLVTRGSSLAAYFGTLGTFVDRYGVERPVKDKYGASTTHMGKLLPRLDSNRQGGCPVLVFGITEKLIDDDMVE
ncbi:MAG: hypothetical protein IH945_02510 [Armatimonadetes bacterium]|nr:hypothetical protein [Armatimonadota bacterium]